MFSKTSTKKEMDEIVKSSTIIGKGTLIEGNIETAGNISVDGKLIGNLKTKSKVNLGNSSEITGNIVAQNAEVGGYIKGIIEVSELLILKPSAVIDGDIKTGKLKVEEGATINGNCQMGAIVKEIKEKETNNGTGVPAKEKSA